MKRIDGTALFGEVPERFDACIAGALLQEEKPMKHKRIPVLVLAVILVIALACTALAVAHRVGLIDVLNTYNPESNGDISSVILDTLPQQGGQMDRAVCTAREAIYDGRMVYFLVDAAPTNEGDALIWGNFMDTLQGVNEAKPYGDTLIGIDMQAVITNADNTQTHGFYVREGAGLVLTGSRMLPAGLSPEVLTIEATITLLDKTTGEPLEDTVLSFEIPRTAEPQVTHIETNLPMTLAEVLSVDIAVTPVETLVSVQARPLLQAFRGFSLIPEDGLVRHYRYSNYLDRDMETGIYTYQFQLPTPADGARSIALWLDHSDMALVIDPDTETVTTQAVQVQAMDVDTIVSLIEEDTK